MGEKRAPRDLASPASGLLRPGKLQSLVHDIADIYRVDTAVPTAIEAPAKVIDDRGDDSPPER